jgi:tetratricopeptide (TPR) repeat protein
MPRIEHRTGGVHLLLAVLAWCVLRVELQGAPAQSSAPANNQASVLMVRGLDLAAHGQLAQAESVLEQARIAAPGDVDVLTALAKVKGRIGEMPEAISIFRAVAAKSPRSADAHLNLAMALADNGDLQGALVEASRAADLSPKLALAHLNRARILADLHRLDEAREEFAIAERLEPSNADCYFYWALVEKENENYAAESDLLRKAIRVQPRNEKALNLLGESLLNQSKVTESIAVWRRLLTIDPDSSEATYSLSQALRATDPEESKRLLARYHSLQERKKQLDRVQSLGNQAYEAMNKRNWPEAITALREAIGLCEDCKEQAHLHKDLGLALCNSGDLPGGAAELHVALRLDPADRDTLTALKMLSHP